MTWINPAFTGSGDYNHQVSLYGDYFNTLNFLNTSKTSNLNLNAMYQTGLPGTNSGIGVQVGYQRNGANGLIQKEVAGLYRYQINLGKNALSIGTRIGYNQWNTDKTATFFDGENFTPYPEEQASNVSADLGVAYESERVQIGLNVKNLAATKLKLYDTEITPGRIYSGFFGYQTNPSKSLVFKPSVYFTRFNEDFYRTDINGIVSWKNKFFGGVTLSTESTRDPQDNGLNHNSSVRMHIGTRIKDRADIILLHDFNPDSYSPAWQLMIRANLGKRK